MPSQYDLPEYQGAAGVEDVNKYNKLPFYLAAMAAKRFPNWLIYNQLFGKLNWQPNMGTTMKGVRAEPSPKGQQVFYPNPMTEAPLKDQHETVEVTEQATLARHKFRSKKFHFLPSYQDFRENQLDFNHNDLVDQIAYKADIFTRSYILQKAPYMYVVGNKAGANELIDAPFVAAGTNVTTAAVAAAKSSAYLKSLIPNVGGAGIALKTVDRMVATLRDDLNAPFFEGTMNTPKDNELVKGKYVMVGSSLLYQMWKYDTDFNGFKSINLDVIHDGFKGSLFDELTFKTDRYPLRVDANGLFPAPQIQDDDGRTVPNPDYNACDIEIGFLLAAESFKTIKVGPPPREFASKKINSDKFFSLNWNGEVRLTDQVLVTYADNSIDLNIDGEYLMLYSHCAYGAMAQDARHCIPFMYRRNLPAKQG